MDNLKRELAKKVKSAAKKQKVILLEVKFKLNVSGVIKEIADDEAIWCTWLLFERL